jgi:hypothetical protein
MKKILASLGLFMMVAVAANAQEAPAQAPANPNAPEMKFDKEVYEFGNVKQGGVVEHEFKFKNTGKEPLIITQAQGSCGCTVPTWPKEPIKKGETAVIKVSFNSAGKMGQQDKTVTITSNAKNNPVVLHIKGNVEKPDETTTPAAPAGH